MIFTLWKIIISGVSGASYRHLVPAIYLGLLITLGASTVPAKNHESSPVGLWQTMDDRTNQSRGTVRIYEEGGKFFGRIESSFNPAELTERCRKCAGDRRDAPVIGLVILRGMTRHGSEFEGGDILDPENGNVYRCKFALSSDGAKLLVRGYLGVSLFGRTQTWTRVETARSADPAVTGSHSLASIGAESKK